MLAHRLLRWPNIRQTLVRCVVFAGIYMWQAFITSLIRHTGKNIIYHVCVLIDVLISDINKLSVILVKLEPSVTANTW